jgi:hypothetical protein
MSAPADPERSKPRWDTSPTNDYPVGPDDAGNAVMHAIGLLVTGWRRLTGSIRGRSR